MIDKNIEELKKNIEKFEEMNNLTKYGKIIDGLKNKLKRMEMKKNKK